MMMNDAIRQTKCEPITSQGDEDMNETVENDESDYRISAEQHAVAEAIARQLFKPVEK